MKTAIEIGTQVKVFLGRDRQGDVTWGFKFDDSLDSSGDWVTHTDRYWECADAVFGAIDWLNDEGVVIDSVAVPVRFQAEIANELVAQGYPEIRVV